MARSTKKKTANNIRTTKKTANNIRSTKKAANNIRTTKKIFSDKTWWPNTNEEIARLSLKKSMMCPGIWSSFM